jgi:hypothetical protein
MVMAADTSTDFAQRRRSELIEAARALPLLDAIARIFYYNTREDGSRGMPIDPAAIGLPFPKQEIENALYKASSLYGEAMHVADALLNHFPGADERAGQMRIKHAGFSEESYDLALTSGFIAMR